MHQIPNQKTDKNTHMKTKTITTYSYDELSDSAKERALDKLYDLDVDHGWWDFVYEDAERIGIRIDGFDLDRNRHCKGNFIESARECADKILKEHGDKCDTYIDAAAFLKERDELVDTAEKDENGDFVNEYELDQKLDELEAEFLRTILEDYSIILQKEYEFLTSREQVEESIRANEYEFDEDGRLA